MKRNSLIILFISLFIIILPACQEDEWADWKLKNDLYMEQLIKDHKGIDSTFYVTNSGLCYQVIYQGWEYNRKPNRSSYVKVNYTGKLIDGSTFDSGSEVTMYMPYLVEGWQEAVSKMNGGGIYKIYIPSTLGYDTISTMSDIPPHSTLIFDVDLIDSYN